MAATSNHDPSGVAEHKPGMLDPPQSLGTPQTQTFWNNPNNRPLVAVPQAILVGVLLFVIGVVDLPWWGAALTALAMLALLRKLLERSRREAAERQPPALS